MPAPRGSSKTWEIPKFFFNWPLPLVLADAIEISSIGHFSSIVSCSQWHFCLWTGYFISFPSLQLQQVLKIFQIFYIPFLLVSYVLCWWFMTYWASTSAKGALLLAFAMFYNRIRTITLHHHIITLIFNLGIFG